MYLRNLFSGLLVGFSVSSEKAVELFDGFEESDYSRATFAGGCFWGLEKEFESLDGVVEAISGYTGGGTEDPSYEDVCSGRTGHYEAVRVYYNAETISFRELLDVFWSYIAPSYPGPSDVGSHSQYTTAVFYHDSRQEKLALESKNELVDNGFDVGTEVRPVVEFYPAEQYHQDYYTRGGSDDVGCYVPGEEVEDG